jgi:hypothetical protein
LKIRSLNIKLGQLRKQVKDNMCNSFLDFWNGETVDAIGSNRVTEKYIGQRPSSDITATQHDML